MSEKMQYFLEKGLTITQNEGFEEDCYCLGFAILFAVTGIDLCSLPQQHLQRGQAVKAILYEKRGVLSKSMIEIIEQLTEREAARRKDNYQLRKILKDKEVEIIHNEEREYAKSRNR
jgi:hypothetical protein